MNTTPDAVLTFWFQDLKPEQQFKVDPALDQLINEKFLPTIEQVIRNETSAWRITSKGRLAEIIVLDQFSRNCFRGTARAFSQDAQALALAQEAIRAGAPHDLSTVEKTFLYMPFMHSESLLIHQTAARLFSEPGLEENLDYEYQHQKIIEQFGRYPHRNQILGRVSTAAELEFLKKHSGF